MVRSTFATVPLAELAEKGVMPDVTPPPPLILVVDDEPTIADTLSQILQGEGFAAVACYAGVDAIEIARLTPPDLLLSDVVMPGMSGVELAIEVIRLVPNCPVVFLSGQATKADLLGKMGRRQFKLLAKPIHPRDLLAEVSRLVTLPDRQDALVYHFPSGLAGTEKEDLAERPTGTAGREGSPAIRRTNWIRTAR